MKNQNLILKFKDQEQEYSYKNTVSIIEDKKLLQTLSRPNIKNQDSSLLIKSMNDTHISDVVQIKINIADTGFVLASFAKETLTDESRNMLLEEIGKLKSAEAPTKENSVKKIQDLLVILNNFVPIYATFSNLGDIKINTEELNTIELNFPLLVLAQPERKMIFKIGKPKKETSKPKKKIIKSKDKKVKVEKVETQKPKKEKVQKEYQPFPLFDSDYFFVLFFSLLASFSITTSIFELMNKEGISAFLIVLAVILAITLVIAVTSVVYKKGELRNPLLRYYLGAFILVGLIIGVVGSFFVCKYLLKTEIEDFDYKKMMLITSLISAALLLSLSLSRFVNFLNKLRLKKKPQ